MTTPTPEKTKSLEIQTEIQSTQAAQTEEIRYMMTAISQVLDNIAPLVDAMARIQDALTARPGIPPAAQIESSTHTTYTASEAVLTYTDKGTPVVRLKGERYSKFGVICWPEILPAYNLDIDQLKPGTNPITPRPVTAALGDNGQPRKIVAPLQPQPVQPPAPRAAAATPATDDIPF
jgi:hypothetical protein